MEVIAREQSREQERLQQLPKSEFLHRVGEIGAVKTTWNLAWTTYESAKKYNGLIEMTLDTAEKSVAFAAEKAMPVVHRFDDQIAYADTFACKTLDKIENSVEKSKKEGAVVAVKDFVHTTLDDTLLTVDSLLDTYLPAGSDEPVNENGSLNGSVPTIDRVKIVGGKIQRRLITRTHSALGNMAFVVDWLQYLQKHANSTNAAIQQRLTEYRKTAVILFAELSKDEPPKSDEQTAIVLARLVAQRLRKIYETLPPILPAVKLLQGYTTDLFAHLTKVDQITSLDTVSEVVLRQAREKIRLVTALIESLSSNLVSKQA